MSERDDILQCLADKPGKVFSRIEIITELAHIKPANIDADLSHLVMRGLVARPKQAHYQHKAGATPKPVGRPVTKPPASLEPKTVSATPAWLVEKLAPYQRVKLYIDAKGPTKRATLLAMLAPFVDGAARVITALVMEGVIHEASDGLMHLGRSPKAPTGQRKWDTRGTKEVAVPEVLPVAAFEPAPELEKVLDTLVSPAEERPVKLHAVPKEEVRTAETPPEATTEDKPASDTQFGGGKTWSGEEPPILFSLHTPELCIDIDGDDEEALEAIFGVILALKVLRMKKRTAARVSVE